MKIKEICTSREPNGDSTWNYRIELDEDYSVNEFIEHILREKPQEWGSFYVVDRLDGKSMNILDESEYKKGEMVSGFREDKNNKKRIDGIISHGGWGMMDYYIKEK